MERVYFWLSGRALEGEMEDGTIHYFEPYSKEWCSVPAWNVVFERIPERPDETELVECERCGVHGDSAEIFNGLCNECYDDVAAYEAAEEAKYDGMKCGDFD